MTQSKRHSRIEIITNILTGMVVAFAISQLAHWLEPTIQKYIWAGFEWKLNSSSNLVMTTILTVVSYARGMFWRRFFNRLQSKSYQSDKNLIVTKEQAE